MERASIGPEVHELKLGKTFSPSNNKTAFHTLKYDFKPASVDLSKVAHVDVSANNQVTVTVPNLESSGVPHTVYKGNQKKYTKEFVLIYDKQTNTMTLEKLNHNILVKKTRTEPPPNKNLAPAPPPKPLENSTQRVSSKTRVSTGARKNTIIGFTPRTMTGSPSTNTHHKSPQSAPAWNANNNQSTLPSIPMIELDEDADRHMAASGGISSALGNFTSMDYHHQASSVAQPQQSHQQQSHQQQSHQQQSHQQQSHPQQSHAQQSHLQQGHLQQGHLQQSHLQQSHMQQNHLPQNHLQQNHLQHQQYHHSGSSSMQSQSNYGGNNGLMMMQTSSSGPTTLATDASRLEEEIGELTTSDSSSDSESSGSGSESDDSDNEPTNKPNIPQQHQQHQQHQQQSYVNGSALILHDDLQLSESNSSDSDDD